MGWLLDVCDVGSPIFSMAKALEAADLIAQKQMACWAGFAFYATSISIVVSAIALFGLFGSLRQTAKSIDVTRKLGEAGVRAYVHVVRAEHHWTNTEGPYTVVLYLANVGTTPARMFEVGGRLDRVKIGEVSKTIVRRPYAMKAWSGIGAGGDPTSVRLDVAEYSDLARDFTQPQSGDVILLQGTVRYQDVFDKWFETDFAFYSYMTTPRGPEREVKLRRPTTRSLRSYEPVPAPEAK